MNGGLRSRPVMGVLLAALLILDLFAMASTLRTHSRVRERAVAMVRERLVRARPALAMPVHEDDPRWPVALQSAMSAVGASRGEVFTEDGRVIVALPGASPENEWPPGDAMERVLAGEVVARVAGDSRGVLSFAAVRPPPGALVLRLATEVPHLREDMRDRQELFLGQGLMFALLLVVGLLSARAGAPEVDHPPSALVAYESAIERLRSHGEAERQRLTDRVEDAETLARGGELTAAIVHEVRNGMGTIVAYARLLERTGHEEQQAHARAIREECESLEGVVRRFMDFVQRDRLEIAAFDVARLLSRVIARESRLSPGGHISFPAVTGLIVHGDEEMLEPAFENLVRNAREAAGPTGRVWVTAGVTGAEAEVTVADDGPGMPKEMREHLRPLATSKPGGLGLGLALATKVVRLHGGSLTLEGHAPRGLLVRVRWPGGVIESDPSVTTRNTGAVGGTQVGHTSDESK